MSDLTTAHQAQIVSHLSKTTGATEADIAKVLEQLGLSDTLKEAEAQLGVTALHHVNPQDVRLSLKIGRLMVAV
jgi:hypothetical protein